MRKMLVAAGGILAVAAVFVVIITHRASATPPRLPEDATPGRLLVGFQDDPTLRWARDRMLMLAKARKVGSTVIRTTVDWSQAAPRRPARPADAFDPVYRLDDVDELARNAQRLGVELLISIWGTPGWANGGEKPNHAPSDPHDLEEFAHALADRYSGRHAGYPSVRLFSVWNEPNHPDFLMPQYTKKGADAAPAAYVALLARCWDVLHAYRPGIDVVGPATSPRGNDNPHALSNISHSPVRFIVA